MEVNDIIDWYTKDYDFKFFNQFEDAKIIYVDENSNEITNSKDPLCKVKLMEYDADIRCRMRYKEYQEEKKWNVTKWVIIILSVIIFSFIISIL